jgi:hypothetical protein
MAGNSYRDYQRRTEARRLGRDIPDLAAAIEEALHGEHSGHARIYGREGGGVVIVHLADDGTSAEHHFGPDQHEEAREHLHKLIADDFSQEETTNE